MRGIDNLDDATTTLELPHTRSSKLYEQVNSADQYITTSQWPTWLYFTRVDRVRASSYKRELVILWRHISVLSGNSDTGQYSPSPRFSKEPLMSES